MMNGMKKDETRNGVKGVTKIEWVREVLTRGISVLQQENVNCRYTLRSLKSN